MQDIKCISSVHNPLVKELVLLKEKSRARKKSGLFIIEGLRELHLAILGGYEVQTLCFCPSLVSQEDALQMLGDASMATVVNISLDVYKKIAHRDTTEGVLAVAKTKSHAINTLTSPNKNPFILVAEAPEKPGNIGALLRTCDAANIDTVFIANPKTDLYNPNIIRSSVGCLFSRNVVIATTAEIIAYLKQINCPFYCAALSAAVPYTAVNFTGPTALVVGTESTGLSQEWLASSNNNIIIPMEGSIDSLNVSVSAAILIFEAKRQRNEQIQ